MNKGNELRIKPSFSMLLKNPAMLLAFGFGSGLSPIMPGTMGTLLAIPLYLLMAQTSLLVYLAITLLSVVIGIFLCGYSSKKLGVHDHSGIVWDEFSGFWISMIAIPLSWSTVLAGFLLFRLFDIVKPWPISLADKHISGGFGIMFDDILAGAAAWLCLFTLVQLGLV